MESTIAEKLQAMIQLGDANSRMKDFYDIWKLSQIFDFDGMLLFNAIKATFESRNVVIKENPAVFNADFASQKDKIVQWSAFIRKSELEDAPTSFEDVLSAVKKFIQPIVVYIVKAEKFHKVWIAPGPWRIN